MTYGDPPLERPGAGDDTRAWGPPYVAGTSTYFTSVNRNKRSITLDLADAGDRELARRLAGRADVLVENFRPGRLAAFGLDHPSLATANPGPRLLLDLRLRQRGRRRPPRLRLPGAGRGWADEHHGAPGEEPTKVGVALVDVLTGLHATIGILAALRERDRSGAGQRRELVGELERTLTTRTAAEWSARLSAHGVPCGPVNDLAAAFALAAELKLDPVAPLGEVNTLANPIRLGRTPVRYDRPPPALGADDAEVRHWLAGDGDDDDAPHAGLRGGG